MLTSLFQAAPAPGTPMGNALGTMLLPAVIFGIFWFLVIQPMRRNQKKAQDMIAKLKKGDEVITSGGIYGRITQMDEQNVFVILQISDNTKVKVLRSRIAGHASEPETTSGTAAS